jgi:cobalt-zinc-cadmium efflux system membrane fusion protein
MALKHLWPVVMIALTVPACNRSVPAATDVTELSTVRLTRWSDRTELFVDFPPLVAGRTSRFAIHLTRLETFRPLSDGRVEVQLRGGGASPEVFHVDAASRPGIFGVEVRPSEAGIRELVILVRTKDLEDVHTLGEVTVYGSEAHRAATTTPAVEPTGISFSKEQQWSLDFATSVVGEQSIRESLRVAARIQARPGGAADVIAPIDGRLTRVLEVTLGTVVSSSQELARLLPPPSLPGDLPQLQRAQAEAHSSLALAAHDRERAERLTAAGAAPQKRLEEARVAEEQAKFRLAAAEASLAQYQAARAGGAMNIEGLFVIRAPLTGVVAQRDATSGANVTAGTTLFRIVDVWQVHLVGQVPEAEASRVRLVTGAEIEAPGEEGRAPAGRLVSIGKVLDPQTRTLPITFAFDNRTFGLPVGHSVFLHLLTDDAAARPVLPAAAVIDDAGRPIVFVQRDGETFERRPVRIGARSRDLVQITEGVSPGERVVTKGAYLLRLASLSTSVPAEGHVH